jgi:sporulation integral membrane protein YtvI
MSMVFVVVIIIAGVISVLYGVGSLVIKLVTNFLADLPEMWENMRLEAQGVLQIFFGVIEKLPGNGTSNLQEILSNSGDYIAEVFSNLSAPTISVVGTIASKVPDIIIFTIMCLIATYFFVIEKEAIHQKFHAWMPKSALDVWDLIKRCFTESIGGYFKAQFKIELWIYLIVCVGLSILKVRYAFLIAFGIAILDLLPVFGTGFVLWPWTLIKLINGHYFAAIGMLAIWGISQFVRQLIQPKYVGDTLGMHPLPTLFLLFTGYKISGVLGMVIAVPLGILVSTLYREGVFRTAEQSLVLLIGRVRSLRMYDEEELTEIKKYKRKEKE